MYKTYKFINWVNLQIYPKQLLEKQMIKKKFIETTKKKQKLISLFFVLLISLVSTNSYAMNNELEVGALSIVSKPKKPEKAELQKILKEKSYEQTIPNYMKDFHENLAESVYRCGLCNFYCFLCIFCCLDFFGHLRNTFLPDKDSFDPKNFNAKKSKISASDTKKNDACQEKIILEKN